MKTIKIRIYDGANIKYPVQKQEFKNTELHTGYVKDYVDGRIKRTNLKSCNIMLFTGFLDKNGKEIYEGDIIGDWTETDQGHIQSRHAVYFDDETGMFRLDTSFEQNRTLSFPLWKELRDFDYEVIGNIYDK